MMLCLRIVRFSSVLSMDTLLAASTMQAKVPTYSGHFSAPSCGWNRSRDMFLRKHEGFTMGSFTSTISNLAGLWRFYFSHLGMGQNPGT